MSFKSLGERANEIAGKADAIQKLMMKYRMQLYAIGAGCFLLGLVLGLCF